MGKSGQFDLFVHHPRSLDEAALMRRLREAVEVGQRPVSKAETRRVMTPLPRVTAFD